ncbi:MAG: precorrin-2 C(20)-methyltransferase [Pseudomonadota bacterium]
MKRLGTLYGIGVGPGDPELLTLKAVKILASLEVVFAAASTKNDHSLALTVVRNHLTAGAQVKQLRFPMTQSQPVLMEAWESNAREVLEVLRTGLDAGFVTLGDPLTYSTFGYLVRMIEKLAPEAEVVTIPGVTAYNAAAAALNLPLVEGKESLLVISGVSEQAEIKELAARADNMVILKTYRDFERISCTLEELGLDRQAILVSRCGHEDERIEKDIRTLRGENMPYLSLLIIKKKTSKI